MDKNSPVQTTADVAINYNSAVGKVPHVALEWRVVSTTVSRGCTWPWNGERFRRRCLEFVGWCFAATCAEKKDAGGEKTSTMDSK